MQIRPTQSAKLLPAMSEGGSSGSKLGNEPLDRYPHALLPGGRQTDRFALARITLGRTLHSAVIERGDRCALIRIEVAPLAFAYGIGENARAEVRVGIEMGEECLERLRTH